MTDSDKIPGFINAMNQAFTSGTFVSVSLGNYKGADDQLKNIYAKQALIKKEVQLSFTYRYKTKDIVKNYPLAEGVSKLKEALEGGFKAATLFTTASDIILDIAGKGTLRTSPPTKGKQPSLEHDKNKHRAIEAKGKKYLHSLGITDKEGNVLKASQDKYRQINHYIELVSPLIKDLPDGGIQKIADMGSGKGYLTFALYDYLLNVLKVKTEVTGVEYRQDMVDLCNKIAADTGFTSLHFQQGTIDNYDSTGTDMLIALHACDTATDDAIAKGITAGARIIVVAPCCHKQVRREMEKHKVQNDLGFLTRHGIFMERQAEMVTDGIRALILEYYGYKTKVFEFISDAHTPKNVMITAVKQDRAEANNPEILKKIKDAKAYFGISSHHLEKAMGI